MSSDEADHERYSDETSQMRPDEADHERYSDETSQMRLR